MTELNRNRRYFLGSGLAGLAMSASPLRASANEKSALR